MTATKSRRRTAISVTTADRVIRAVTVRSSAETIPLEDATGRVLREEIPADRDFPPFDRVAMDGIAFAYRDYTTGVRTFSLDGVQAAGALQKTLSGAGCCIEVMTGAILPRGCDCVVPVEELEATRTTAAIVGRRTVTRFQNIHRRASDHERGAVLLRAGTRLRSTEIAVCATVGRSDLVVSRLPAVAIVSTGDELVEIDRVPEAHQIRMSNSRSVEAAILHAGCARTERFHAVDEGTALERLFVDLFERFDVVVVSGGVSAGKFDFVPAVLEGVGVHTLFHQVAQRPGHPLLFGIFESEKAVFGLPGNPVSALVSAHRYLIPFLQTHMGTDIRPRPRAALCEDLRFDAPLTRFLPVRVEADGYGRLLARPVALNGSGDLAGLTESDGFIELPGEVEHFAAGSAWPYTRWE